MYFDLSVINILAVFSVSLRPLRWHKHFTSYRGTGDRQTESNLAQHLDMVYNSLSFPVDFHNQHPAGLHIGLMEKTCLLRMNGQNCCGYPESPVISFWAYQIAGEQWSVFKIQPALS